MIYIKKFIEKVSYIEGRQGKDVVLPIVDARGLRDELAKILADLYIEKPNVDTSTIQVELKGGSFK